MTETSASEREGWGRVVQDRLAKLEALRERGVEPFAYSFEPSHDAATAVGLLPEGVEEGETVRVAGRIVAVRDMGKSTFMHLADRSGRIQLYFRINSLGEEVYSLLGLLDTSDWLGVAGPLFRTRTGEVTVRVEQFRLLAKAIRPLPLGKEEIDAETGERRVYSGFADREMRYRQRYVDLAVSPESREVFVTRARVITAIRRFLDERGFLEVETPVLQPLYGGATARPFVTHHNALDIPLYLRIADELYLKRLIVGGLDRVYEIGKDFRNEGMDRFHNPEFTMLEFYAAYLDYEAVMALTEELVRELARAACGALRIPVGGEEMDFSSPFRRLTYHGALRDLGGVDIDAAHEDELRQRAASLGVADVGRIGRAKLIDELFSVLVEHQLREPTFIIDFPREMSPLAKPKRGNPDLTERFELYLAGREIVNAYSELNDPLDQRERLEAQARLREAGDEEAQPLDEDFLRALEYGMPPTGGFGMGVDRLVMLLTNQASIRDVVLFPTMRPE